MPYPGRSRTRSPALLTSYEGADSFDAACRNRRGGDPDIHRYIDPNFVSGLEVNAFPSGSNLIVQKSTKEGFGLTVTEAMWKGTPVIGDDCGGIRLQIQDGETGILNTRWAAWIFGEG